MAQSKWTIANIKSAVAAYCSAAKQANSSWDPSDEDISGLMEKIMKTVTIDGQFIDKLPELDGESLEFGQAIEEYYMDLVPVQDYDDFEGDYPDGADEGAAADAENRPYRPAFETVYYDERLGRKMFATTVDENKYQVALTNQEELSNLTALVMKRLYNSYAMWKYNTKKKLLGNLIQKANSVTVSDTKVLIDSLAKPVDTDTGEAFVKEVKNLAEKAGFVSENTSLSKTTIGANEGLMLYIKPEIQSVLDVDVKAGAFGPQFLNLDNVTVKVVEDFGTIPDGGIDAYAVLIDPRGVKLHRNYEAVRDNEVAAGDYHNFFLHTEHTGFISPFTFVKVFVAPSN